MSEEIDFFEDSIAWLKTATPDDWHRVALDYNWGEGVETLYWIVQQPDCDRATALDIFWKGQPAYYLYLALSEGRDDADDLSWSMLKYISARINAQGYTRSQIAFDATPLLRQDYEQLASYAKQMPSPPLKPHRDMLRSARGREIVNDLDFYQRYPFAHSVMIELPALDGATINRIPDLVAARDKAHTVVTNLFAIGCIAVALVIYPKIYQDITVLTTLLAGFGLCAYSAFTEFCSMNGLLRANRLRFVPSILFGVLVSAVLSGAVALKPAVLFRDWFLPAYGMVGSLAVIIVAVVLVYLVIGKGLARILISPQAMREV